MCAPACVIVTTALLGSAEQLIFAGLCATIQDNNMTIQAGSHKNQIIVDAVTAITTSTDALVVNLLKKVQLIRRKGIGSRDVT